MSWDPMKVFITAMGAIVTALILPAAAQSLSKDIAGRIEAIPIQTLTISDEQFLKGDAYGKPTIEPADICPLYLRKRTSTDTTSMSA